MSAADANILINTCRLAAQRYTFAYQEPIPVEQLVRTLCDNKQVWYGGQVIRPDGITVASCVYEAMSALAWPAGVHTIWWSQTIWCITTIRRLVSVTNTLHAIRACLALHLTLHATKLITCTEGLLLNLCMHAPILLALVQTLGHLWLYTRLCGRRSPTGQSKVRHDSRCTCRDVTNGFQLYQSDPSGNYGGWKATAIGANSQGAQNILKQDFKDEITLEEAVKLVIKVMQTPSKAVKLVPVGSNALCWLAQGMCCWCLNALSDKLMS